MTDPLPVNSLVARSIFPWIRLRALALSGISSPHTRRAYDQALGAFHSWYTFSSFGGFSPAVVQQYRDELEREGRTSSTINVHLAALRKLASTAAEHGLLAPELTIGILKVKRMRQEGSRTGQWLRPDQVEQLLRLPDVSTAKGRRDQTLLALLIGCGMQRSELAALTVGQILNRQGRWIIEGLIGRGQHRRSIPMPLWAKESVDRWTQSAGIVDGRVLRSINKAGRVVGDRMTPQSIFEIVECYSESAGFRVAPRDLRRTFARLAHAGRAAVEQIQFSLGHSSPQTTQRYLGLEQNLLDAPCDRLGVRI